MQKIPNVATTNFGDPKCRRELMAQYGDSKFPYYGSNEEGESVLVSIAKDSIVTRTFQHNGWVRVNYYDANGLEEGSSFEGRWNEAPLQAKADPTAMPVSFDFGTGAKHSNVYYTATKFVDTVTAPHCQAIQYVFTLTKKDNGMVWNKKDHRDFPVSNVALRRQFNAMIQHLDRAWCKRKDELPDPKRVLHWIAENCDTTTENAYTFALTDIALFYMSFKIELTAECKLNCVTVQMDVFNRMYITQDPFGAALVPDCVADYPKMDEQKKNLAFAAAVCSEVLSNMGDGPGVQVRLREAIKTLDKLSGRG